MNQLPEIGAVVKDVLVSRGLDSDDVIVFEGGLSVEVRKRKRDSPVRMVRDRGEMTLGEGGDVGSYARGVE